MRYHTNTRIMAKLALIFFGLLFLVCIWLGRREQQKEEPQGEPITYDDVKILMNALNVAIPDGTAADGAYGDESDKAENGGKASGRYLTYAQYITICGQIGGENMDLPDYSDRYEPEYRMLKTDWYDAYRIMLAYLDPESTVWESSIFILKVDNDGKKVYTENSGLENAYGYRSAAFEENALRELRVYIQGQELLTVVEALSGEHELHNVWISESGERTMECFYHDITFDVAADQTAQRECVADLTIRDGKVIRAAEKSDKVHGKLLRVSDDGIELEGCGIYPVADDMEVYKLYGRLETLKRSDLKIGYADTDYVVEKGKVCACLVSVREDADRIRVLLKNTAGNSNYYDAVELIVDDRTERIEAEDLKEGERRIYRCAALTDKIIVNAEGIEKADNAYRGSIECYRSHEGIVLINELPLEEYLYAVVPSEMPASYPAEALKAQAVCARTYAYMYILHAGLPEEGAHVDDTTSYQVYHNIAENAATTTAVRETEGMLLVYEGEPAQNYYYSTSCGVGTDTGIWRPGGLEDSTYMQAVRLSGKTPDMDPADLSVEENFRAFITSVDENDLECDEPWYRWTYEVHSVDTKELLSRIRARYDASPQSVLTKTQGDYYVSEPVEKLGDVHNIAIVKRGAGGVAEELLIEADSGTYKIVSEYNIRSVLCDRKSEVVKQDGSSVVPASLVPSGFFVIETGQNDGDVVGYTLTGGGYGHGVGMSQNGAKALGLDGASCEEILQFFFRGCSIGGIAPADDAQAIYTQVDCINDQKTILHIS